MIEKVLFDLGNVLLKFDFNRAQDRMVARGADLAALTSDPMTELKNAYETGEVSTVEFIERAAALTGYHGDAAHFEQSWQDIFEINEPMEAFLRSLSGRGTPCYLLSNSNDMHVRFIRGTYDILDPFEDVIFSHDARMMKPDARIFQLAIDRFGLTPDKTLYIDDLPANIEAGRAQGLHGLLYDSNDHANAAAQLSGYRLTEPS